MGKSPIIKKILVFTGMISGLCIAAMIIISIVYGDKITALVIKKINENLNTEVSVRSAEFSIFKRFPHSAVVFNEVVIKSGKDFRDDREITTGENLLKCKNIYVEINILKLLLKDYTISRIVAENGDLNLVINGGGIRNFDILKKSESSSSGKTTVQLAEILLEDFNYHYQDHQQLINVRGFASKIGLNGKIEGDRYNFNLNFQLLSHTLNIKNSEYLKDRRLETTFILKKQNDLFHLKTSLLKIEDVSFKLWMEMVLGKDSEINLLSEAPEANLAEFQRLVPDEYQKYIADFECRGKTNFLFSVKGKTSGNSFPHLELSFRLLNCSVRQKKTNIKLSGINCTGKFTNGEHNNPETSIFRIDNFNSVLENGQIAGYFRYSNFTKPKIAADIKSSIDLGNFRKFMSIDTVENLEGKLKGNISFQAGFKNSAGFTRENIESFRVSGNVIIQNAELKLRNSGFFYRDINSRIILGYDFQIESLSLKIDDNDFFIKGKLADAVPYLLHQNSTLNLEAELRSQNLDLSKYFEKDPKRVSADRYEASMLFPDDLFAKLNVSASNFKLKKFNAKNAIAHVNYKPGMYTLNSAVFETMKGRVAGNGAVLLDFNKNLIVKGQTSLKKIDIRQLFYVFDNFGQAILRDNHLNGSLTGDILMSCEWDNNMNLDKNKVLVESNLEIANGELINFEPLLGLSRFIALSELKDIRFSTLKNQIFIRHQQIIIPQMDINSSAFNISGNGIHNFDNHYTYHINVLLSDVLARKARQNKKENTEFGIIEDDGLGETRIPLMIVGYNDDYRISYDTKGLKQIIKESVIGQKSELKSIFREEFGFYKNDTTVNRTQTNSKFKVEWDEQPDAEKKPETTGKKRKKTFEEEEGFQVEFDK